jgi:ATP-binding cassette subfamily G (WHITE) protein 2 (PDR)
VIGFYVFFLTTYLIVSELNSGTSSTAEVLLFLRQSTKSKAKILQQPSQQQTKTEGKLAAGAEVKDNPKSVFTWQNVTYDIHIKNEPRRLLDNVTGWARPGTLTALMGVSGAGKTTLLDVLAQRTSVGVVTGDMFVNGKPFDSSFQRKLGMFTCPMNCPVKSLIAYQVMFSNKISTSRRLQFGRHCDSVPCFASLSLSHSRRSILMSRR